MTNRRFWIVMGVVFVALGLVTFVVVSLVLEADDDGSSPATTTSTTVGIATTTTTPDELTTPTFVAVVVSEAEEATARSTADELTDDGFDSAVLHSDDYSSLNPGFWVAYVGPFDDLDGAEAAVSDLEEEGYTAAYPRCVGSADECNGEGGNGDGDDED